MIKVVILFFTGALFVGCDTTQGELVDDFDSIVSNYCLESRISNRNPKYQKLDVLTIQNITGERFMLLINNGADTLRVKVATDTATGIVTSKNEILLRFDSGEIVRRNTWAYYYPVWGVESQLLKDTVVGNNKIGTYRLLHFREVDSSGYRFDTYFVQNIGYVYVHHRNSGKEYVMKSSSIISSEAISFLVQLAEGMSQIKLSE